MSVPGVTNAHMQAFLNTSTLPLSALGFQQSPAVRDALAGFLTATAAGAALLYLDQDVELYIGMGDGMVRARPRRVPSQAWPRLPSCDVVYVRVFVCVRQRSACRSSARTPF
jgi:hypothetical protein